MSVPDVLVFLDLETTGLDVVEDRVWEFAAVRREGGSETAPRVRPSSRVAAGRLPERFRADLESRFDPSAAVGQRELAALAWSVTRGARVVGACPWFDTGFLGRVLLRHQLESGWDYRLVDVESLAAGHLGRPVAGLSDAAQALGVRQGDHTAMGDVLAAMAVYDAVMRRAAVSCRGEALREALAVVEVDTSDFPDSEWYRGYRHGQGDAHVRVSRLLGTGLPSRLDPAAAVSCPLRAAPEAAQEAT